MSIDQEAVSDAITAKLRAFVERVERLEEEIKSLNADKAEVYADAKANGYDVPALKEIVKLRRTDEAKRLELSEMVELYAKRLGVIL
jgi:uncharacterized protein (UPF0335 family)